MGEETKAENDKSCVGVSGDIPVRVRDIKQAGSAGLRRHHGAPRCQQSDRPGSQLRPVSLLQTGLSLAHPQDRPGRRINSEALALFSFIFFIVFHPDPNS